MQLYFYKTFIKYWNCNSAKTEENFHENNNAPSERVSSHCGTVVSHCPLVLYNHMYLFPVQFEFLQMMAPKKCSWVISQKMGYLIYIHAYVKHTLSRLNFIHLPFQFESWSWDWLSLQKKATLQKDLRLAKSPKLFIESEPQHTVTKHWLGYCSVITK